MTDDRLGGARQPQARWQQRYLRERHPFGSSPAEILVQLCAGLVPGAALDLGCGDGRNAVFLHENGWSVTGVDYAPAAIEHARADTPGVRWICADVTAEVVLPASQQLACCVYLHTSTAERSLWLQQAAKALVAGGMLVYVGHAPAGTRDPLRPSPWELGLQEAGFEICQQVEMAHTRTGESGHKAERDFGIRARRTG